jgi:hypothetical protein
MFGVQELFYCHCCVNDIRFSKKQMIQWQLCEIACVVGTRKLELAAMECLRRGQFPSPSKEENLRDLMTILYPRFPQEDWEESVIDLVTPMLEPVPSRRLSSEHKFFAELRGNEGE